VRFTNVRELKLETNKVLELSEKNGPVVVTRRGHPIAILRTITEESLTLKIAPLWNRVRKAAERAGYGPNDVEKLIKQVRSAKPKE